MCEHEWPRLANVMSHVELVKRRMTSKEGSNGLPGVAKGLGDQKKLRAGAQRNFECGTCLRIVTLKTQADWTRRDR